MMTNIIDRQPFKSFHFFINLQEVNDDNYGRPLNVLKLRHLR